MKSFSIDLYDCVVRVYFDDVEYTKDTGFSVDECHGQVSHDGSTFYIFMRDATDVNTLAHESFHVASRIFDYTGNLLQPETSNEHMAYLIGFIAEKIYSFWNEEHPLERSR